MLDQIKEQIHTRNDELIHKTSIIEKSRKLLQDASNNLHEIRRGDFNENVNRYKEQDASVYIKQAIFELQSILTSEELQEVA